MRNSIYLVALIGVGNLAEAKLVTKAIAYEHNGVKLEGYLAYDDEKTATRNLPGVLVFPEWWGLNSYVKGRTEDLARLGYVAFAADIYGKGVVTDDPARAEKLVEPFEGKPLMAERAQAGFVQLMKVDVVDTSKLTAVGFCFRGSTAQALAYSGAPLRGIVSFHGGPVPAPASAAGEVKAEVSSSQRSYRSNGDA